MNDGWLLHEILHQVLVEEDESENEISFECCDGMLSLTFFFSSNL